MEDLSYLDGLVVNEFGNYHIVWCEDLGYALFERPLFGPRKGEWCRLWYEKSEAQQSELQLPSAISQTAVQIVVHRCERSPILPCPTYIHRESRVPCVTVFARKAHKVEGGDDQLFIELLSLVLKIPEHLHDKLNSTSYWQFVATLQFTEADPLAPILLDALPFVERKGYLKDLSQESGTCRVSVGFGCFDVEPHVVKFAQSSSEEMLHCGDKISVIMGKDLDETKSKILRIYRENNPNMETDSALSIINAGLRGPEGRSSPSTSATCDDVPPNLKRDRRVTFDEEDPKRYYYDEYDETPYNIRDFLAYEPMLVKPVELLRKNPVKSTMKKAATKQDPDSNTVSMKLSADRRSFGCSSSDNRVCGCSPFWLNHMMSSNPTYVKLKLEEPVFLVSRHTHNIGKPGEYQVWKGITHLGFVEFLPSALPSSFRLKMGTWIKVWIQKIDSGDQHLGGLIVTPGTSCEIYNGKKTPDFRIQSSKYKENVQVPVQLTRNADSGGYMNSAIFGVVFIPSELLNKYCPYPEGAHHQVFSAWIEPISEIRRVENQSVCWKAFKLVYCSAKSAEQYLADLVNATQVTPTLSFSENYTMKLREHKKKKSEARRERKRSEAAKDGVTYIPKFERLNKIEIFLHYLATGDDFPDFVSDDVVIPCTHILQGNETSKTRQLQILTRIIAQVLVVSNEGQALHKDRYYKDRLITSLVQILQENSTFVDFEAEGEEFGKLYHGFLSYYGVDSSSSD